MKGPRYQVHRRFTSWLGEVFDVLDTHTGRTIAMVGCGKDARQRAERQAVEANAKDEEFSRADTREVRMR